MTIRFTECFWKSTNKQQQQSITHTSTDKGPAFLNTPIFESLPVPGRTLFMLFKTLPKISTICFAQRDCDLQAHLLFHKQSRRNTFSLCVRH